MTTKPNSGTVSVSRELLPCPFCGSSDVKIATDDGIHFAQCCKCEATGPTGFKRGEEDDADWNNRAQPADQQGEPYRYIVRSTGGGSLSCKPDAAHESLWQDEGRARRYYASGKELHADPKVFWPEEYQIVPLYRHAQPATAKVVLPERMPTGNITTPHHDLSPGVREGWNACLYEVVRLNGIET
ncbi:Lar family restriction alleviation protein [Pseudomonas alliivorans]|nr:Lar family restriction alleviation protein [Pseudomonas alliivorans]